MVRGTSGGTRDVDEGGMADLAFVLVMVGGLVICALTLRALNGR